MAYPTDYPAIPVGTRPPYGSQVPMQVPMLGGGMIMDKQRLMAILQRYFDGQITKADYMRAMQAYFAQVPTEESPPGAVMPERPEFEKPEITTPTMPEDIGLRRKIPEKEGYLDPSGEWKLRWKPGFEPTRYEPSKPLPSVPSRETKLRRIYSFRDRVQPPKAAQPSVPQALVTETQPEGRPAKYQYPQYGRKAYGWQRKGNLSWW